MAICMKDVNMVMEKFRRFDADNSGSITERELTAVLMELQPRRFDADSVHSMFDVIDTDDDGLVCIEEFTAWIFGGSRSVFQLAAESLEKAVSDLRDLALICESGEQKFLLQVKFPAVLSFKDWCAHHKDYYKGLEEPVYEERDTEYCGDMLTKKELVRKALDDSEVREWQKQQHTAYCLQHAADIAAHPFTLREVSFQEAAGNWSKLADLASELVRFVRDGGAIPKGLHEKLLGSRSCLNSWKSKAKKQKGGYLVTEERPGCEREAVYILDDSDMMNAKVSKLKGVRWQPAILATKDGTGAWTLPLNDSQKNFDLIKPAALASCCLDLNQEIDAVLAVLRAPSDKPPEELRSVPREDYVPASLHPRNFPPDRKN
eukprot:gb/GFBE01003711.1/.p1 GENE.gb/GFBE01003711.1/~~gb/GFBE01003711.1/.p1  ORF type:complete len:375 (+),score=96.38 gb/GFBE01003711.1/:1-1125(+)